MFFLFSKLLFFLLHPLNWVLVLLLIRFWVKQPRAKKRLLIGAIALLILSTNGAFYGSLAAWWQPEVKPQRHQEKYDTSILLTGISAGNSKKERYFTGAVSDRFIQAARLYHTGTVKRILISGGNGLLSKVEYLDADFLKEELMAQGIPDSAILTEKRSRNSYESAIYAKPILDSLHATSSCVLVTSAMHMQRAIACFRKAGIEPIPHVANYEILEHRIGIGSFIPDLTLPGQWQSLLKEMVGLAVYKATGKA